jgi:hypothetical protein
MCLPHVSSIFKKSVLKLLDHTVYHCDIMRYTKSVLYHTFLLNMVWRVHQYTHSLTLSLSHTHTIKSKIKEKEHNYEAYDQRDKYSCDILTNNWSLLVSLWLSLHSQLHVKKQSASHMWNFLVCGKHLICLSSINPLCSKAILGKYQNWSSQDNEFTITLSVAVQNCYIFQPLNVIIRQDCG